MRKGAPGPSLDSPKRIPRAGAPDCKKFAARWNFGLGRDAKYCPAASRKHILLSCVNVPVLPKMRASDSSECAMTEAEAALRKALLDVLIALPVSRHSSQQTYEEAAAAYEKAAEDAHPAVAEVFREAAKKVRG
ncbi:hypothetical protein GCM10017322_28460 [Paracoccus aerius]|nr:hypothetical protein GCM10017322_28460 [Paracoccus aerius]